MFFNFSGTERVKMLGFSSSSSLDWGSYIVSITNITSKKRGPLTGSIKFLSSEVVLYFYKSPIQLIMEYCCHALAIVPSCYLIMLDKQQKPVSRAVVITLSATL